MINKNNPFSDDRDYFKQANHWAEDRLETAQISAARWFIAFLFMSLIILALIITLFMLLPLKKVIPIVIHQNTKTGESWVDQPNKTFLPETRAQTEADIVRYITARESYTAEDINQRFHLVMLLSNRETANYYADSQSSANPHSPINALNDKGLRTVHIEDIVFLDKANHPSQDSRQFHLPASNLAKVDFTTQTMTKNGVNKTHYWVATLSWIYQGLPDNPQDAWDNWNGFTVIAYRLDPRNMPDAG